ncbi:hypothetical protein MKZ38_008277 [Zalerion maritima]|uniref:Uncharacterized protein n=1 Tax=Zalerion maritima TaxID=339359 RepID=A0AAD5RL34_9PEZI|nr:hypothetical protein MKZ38_008277 [Zalerion maritima]
MFPNMNQYDAADPMGWSNATDATYFAGHGSMESGGNGNNVTPLEGPVGFGGVGPYVQLVLFVPRDELLRALAHGNTITLRVGGSPSCTIMWS